MRVVYIQRPISRLMVSRYRALYYARVNDILYIIVRVVLCLSVMIVDVCCLGYVHVSV